MTTADDLLPIAEVFGPTFQGEGPSTGQVASFIRLGGCNLTCDRCDTPYTWNAKLFDLRRELSQCTVPVIIDQVPTAPLVVITGGEPLLYQHRSAFRDLLSKLRTSGARVEIETNGTIAPHRDLERPWIRFNVSPKLHGPMSHDEADKRIRPDALQAFAVLAASDRAAFKFVVQTTDDVTAAVSLADEYDVPRRQVWVMPQGVTPDTTLYHARLIADAALTAGVNLTLRQHVLLWPDTKRGR